MNKLEEFLKPTQKKLFTKIENKYKPYGTVISRRNYILVCGQAPVLLVAHLDTVHESVPNVICKSEDGNILMSPQGIGGDDRCGVYALVTVYAHAKVKPWLLFTCEEEIGGVGASVFCKHHKEGNLPDALDDLKAIIEIDRKGSNDAVYYECDNVEFEEYITSKGFQTEFGSFSDISLIAPRLKVAAVNLSSGYYNAHKKHEYINLTELRETIRRVMEIVEESVQPDFPRYEYVSAFSRIHMMSSSYRFDDEQYGDYEDFSDVPSDIRIPYALLSDIYSRKELDHIRKVEGDRYIPLLAKSEFGKEYYEYLVNAEQQRGDPCDEF